MAIVIPVISYPRTGSTYLMDLLESFEGSMNLLEIFHQDYAAVPADLRQRLEQHYPAPEYISEVKHLDPRGVLRVMQDLNTQIVFLKVFPWHLTLGGVRRLLEQSAGGLFLTRNLLSSWVSREIAISIGRYGGVDTREIQVAFKPEDFKAYGSSCLGHMVDVYEIAESLRLPVLLMDYQQLENGSDPRRLVLEALSSSFGLTLVEDRTWRSQVRRQDGRSVLTRLTNADECVSWLSAAGLEFLLEDGQMPSEIAELSQVRRILS